MKQINELWPERLQAYIKELRRYFKYMFNDHLLFVLIFGGGAAIYYYSGWVKTLDSGFPVGVIMAIVLGIILAVSPIQTLLKDADIVFLLPIETKLGSYFKSGMKLSFITQAYVLILVLAAFMPMYVQVTGDGFKAFFYLLAIVLLLKIWNLVLHWMILKINDKQSLFFDWILRFSMSALLLYFFIEKASVWFIAVIILILFVVTLYFRNATKYKTLKWEVLIEKEQNRMQTFYQAANMFTDVPHLRGRVKRRKWLDPLFSSIPFSSDQTYRFLLTRTIVRTNEFSGLILRLTLIPVVLIIFNSNIYFSLAISLLFIYLTGFQLIPLLRKHELKIWTSLYPIPKNQKKIAFLNLLMKVLLIQAIILSVSFAVGGGIILAAIHLVVSCLFAILLTKLYVPSRLKKLERR